jgi:hypothetical protein
MAHGRSNVAAERIIALASAREPSRSKTELYSCLALLFGAIATLTAVVTYLAIAPGTASTGNLTSARSLMASLGLVTGVLAFFSARLFVHRLKQVPLRRLRVDKAGIAFEAPGRHRDHGRMVQERLIDFSGSFGLTLLSDPIRHRLVLAVTATGRAVYFSARVSPDERHAYRSEAYFRTRAPFPMTMQCSTPWAPTGLHSSSISAT